MKEKKYENERGMIPLERYYQPEIETASREQIKAWQDERLVKQVQHVWDNVPYYRKKMEEKGVTPDDVKSVDDLHKLPFLTKDDLRIADALQEIPAVQEIIFREHYAEIYLEHDLPEETIRQAIEGCGAYRVMKIDR